MRSHPRVAAARRWRRRLSPDRRPRRQPTGRPPSELDIHLRIDPNWDRFGSGGAARSDTESGLDPSRSDSVRPSDSIRVGSTPASGSDPCRATVTEPELPTAGPPARALLRLPDPSRPVSVMLPRRSQIQLEALPPVSWPGDRAGVSPPPPAPCGGRGEIKYNIFVKK